MKSIALTFTLAMAATLASPAVLAHAVPTTAERQEVVCKTNPAKISEDLRKLICATPADQLNHVPVRVIVVLTLPMTELEVEASFGIDVHHVTAGTYAVAEVTLWDVLRLWDLSAILAIELDALHAPQPAITTRN